MIRLTHRTRSNLRLVAIALLILAVVAMYFLTIGLDRTSILVGEDNKLDIESAGWNIKFLNWLSPITTISEIDGVVNNLIFFISVVLALSAFAQAILFDRSHDFKAEQLRQLFPVSSVPVQTVGVDDIATMTYYYRGADFVTVFAGDFSWLAKDDEISREVDRLAKEKKIRFHSSRDRTAVSTAIGRKKLESYLPLFSFSSPAGFKASLVQMQGGRQYLLYHRRETASKGEIIIFENSNSLSEPISRLSSFVRQLRSPPLIVFVCGETGSGKTKVARHIQAAANAQLLSVGDYFRQVTEAAGQDQTDRNTVIQVGRKFLDRFGSEELARVLISKFDATKETVVIDGLRPPEAIDYIRSRFPNYLVVYVDAPMKIRVERCKDFELEKMDPSIDVLVRSVSTYPSTIRIDNGLRSLEDLRSLVEQEVIGRFEYLSKQ